MLAEEDFEVLLVSRDMFENKTLNQIVLYVKQFPYIFLKGIEYAWYCLILHLHPARLPSILEKKPPNSLM